MGDFENMLLRLQMPDDNVRNQAEAEFKAAKEQQPATVVSALVQLLSTSEKQTVRHICTVHLRPLLLPKNLPALELNMSPDDMLKLQQALPDLAVKENVPHVRKSICYCIAELGAGLIPQGKWQELLPLIFDFLQNEEPRVREVALILINNMITVIEPMLVEAGHQNSLLVGLNQALNDPVEEVRVTALQAVSTLLQFVGVKVVRDSNNLKAYQKIVPVMMECLKALVHKEKAAKTAIEALINVAEKQYRFFRAHIADTFEVMLTIAQAPHDQVAMDVRHLAVEFCLTMTEEASGLVKKVPNFMERFVPFLIQMLISVDETPEWETEPDDDEDVTDDLAAMMGLDRLAIKLGNSSKFVQLVWSSVGPLFNNDNWRAQHAALITLTQIAEGCVAYFQANIGDLINLVVGLVAHQHPRVRWAALKCIGQFSEDFRPLVQENFHEQVLPATADSILANMDNPRVQARAATTVVDFVENVSPKYVTPYLSALLRNLHQMLCNGKTRVAQQEAITAIAAIAGSCSEHFEPFYDDFMPMMKNVVSAAQGEENDVMRGKAMECIGFLGASVSKQKFQPDALAIMELLGSTNVNDLELADPVLTYIYQAFGRIAHALEGDFAPYVPAILPKLLVMCDMQPELSVLEAGEELAPEAEAFSHPALLGTRVQINTNLLEDKCGAVLLLVSMAQDMGAAFAPHVEECIPVLTTTLQKVGAPLLTFYYHSQSRTSGACLIPELILCLKKYAELNNDQNAVNAMRQVWTQLEVPLLQAIEAEPDPSVLVPQLESLQETLGHLGENGLTEKGVQKSGKMFLEIIKDIHRRAADTQRRREDEDFDHEQEAETNLEDMVASEIADTVAGTVHAVLKSMRASYLPTFQTFYEPVYELLPRGASDRKTALDIIAAVIEHTGPACMDVAFLQTFMERLVGSINDMESAVRGAAAKCVMHLAEHSGTLIPADGWNSIVNELVVALQREDARDDFNGAPTDAALAALTKIMQHQGNSVNVADIFPGWLGLLPATGTEAPRSEPWALTSHQYLCAQVEASSALLTPERIARAIMVLITVYGREVMSDASLNVRIHRVLTALGQQGDALSSIAQQLDQPMQAKLQEIISTQLPAV